ncbi:MAG: hypothetical protein HRT60_11330 [Dinoroseobacter sp.]|nr:hypothetical protein [Dinoroseobacter sp.]
MKKIFATAVLVTSLAAPATIPTVASAQLSPAAVRAQCAANPAGCAAIVRQAVAAIKARIAFDAAGRITNVAAINASIGAIVAEVVDLYEASQAQTGGLPQEVLDDLAEAIEEVGGDRDGGAEGSGYIANADADGNIPDFIDDLADDLDEIAADVSLGNDVDEGQLASVESGSTS